jgi:pSer/pThr/pTyr-binding forkhead associated (FHA) protein
MRVGRTGDCDITIDDSRVSRNHALLRIENERVILEDMGSANGTLVNGLRLVGTAELNDGDDIQFDKYSFKMSITRPVADADDDATVFAPLGDDATEVAPVPAAEPVAAPQPAAEPASASPDLPGSWVDSGTGEHTQFLSMESPEVSAATDLPRASDHPHLMVVRDGAAADVFELEPGSGEEPDVWEVGREDSCEIMLAEPSVSARHAQLIHQGGRWRLVNLVSANGIFVNGDKRLTAYLADGDQISLGKENLEFRTSINAPAASTAAASTAASAGPTAGGLMASSRARLAVAGVLALVVLAGIVWLVL